MIRGDIIKGKKGFYEVIEVLQLKGYHNHYKAISNGNLFFCKERDNNRRFHLNPEVRSLNLLERDPQPNTVPLVDLSEDGLTLVFPYVQAINVDQYLENGRMFAIPTVLTIVDGVHLVLNYFHERGFAYLDVKADNILLKGNQGVLKMGVNFHVPNAHVYLTDFGTVRKFGKINDRKLIGSPCTSSPEQIIEGEVDQRTDVYGLGATLFELFLGEIAYSNTTISKMLESILDDPVPRLDVLNSKLSKDLSDVIHKAMQKKRRDRFENVDEFVAAFKEVI